MHLGLGVSGYRFWIWKRIHLGLGVYTLGVYTLRV